MDIVKSKTKVEVLMSTVEQMGAGGQGKSKWFALNEYDNHADFFNASLAHAQTVWGEKSPSMRITHVNTSMPHLDFITERGIDGDLWLLMEIGDIEEVKIVEAYIEINGKDKTTADTIENAINLFQGRHDSDEQCVDNYIAEFGSIKEADETVSPYLTKEQYTAHFMKVISKTRGFYFNR